MAWDLHEAMNAFIAASIFTVALRWYARLRILKHTGLEDWFVTGSLVSLLAWLAVFHVAVRNGFGISVDILPPISQTIVLQTIWIAPALHGLTTALCKLSIVWQYRRVFPKRSVLKACDALMVVLTIYGAWSFFGNMLRCYPIQSMWNREIKPDHCIDLKLLHYSSYFVNLLMDAILLFMPLVLVQGLQIPKEQKRSLYVVFALGGFTMFASIMRLVAIPEAVHGDDWSRDAVPVAVWSGIEMSTGIICACLAVLRPLLARIFPNIIETTAINPKHKRTRSDYDKMDVESRRKSLWGDTPLAKTIQIYRTVEMSSENVSRRNSEVDLVGTKTDCYYGNHTFKKRHGLHREDPM